jgi:molybdenum cofactor cytidylyltransferase
MKTAALVLAAGSSARLGQPKQLLPWGGGTLLENAVRAAADAGCAPILVITGAGAERVASALTHTAAEIVYHPDWAEGIGSSIAAGITALARLAPDCDAVMLTVCDQPLVTGAVLARLRQALMEHGGKSIAASAYANTLGVPALFSRRWFPALAGLSGHTGAKRVIEANSSEVISCPFPDGVCDIDTPADWTLLNAPSFAAPR